MSRPSSSSSALPTLSGGKDSRKIPVAKEPTNNVLPVVAEADRQDLGSSQSAKLARPVSSDKKPEFQKSQTEKPHKLKDVVAGQIKKQTKGNALANVLTSVLVEKNSGRVVNAETDSGVLDAIKAGSDFQVVRKKKDGSSKQRGSFFGFKSSAKHEIVADTKPAEPIKPPCADASCQTDLQMSSIQEMESELESLRAAFTIQAAMRKKRALLKQKSMARREEEKLSEEQRLQNELDQKERELDRLRRELQDLKDRAKFDDVVELSQIRDNFQINNGWPCLLIQNPVRMFAITKDRFDSEYMPFDCSMIMVSKPGDAPMLIGDADHCTVPITLDVPFPVKNGSVWCKVQGKDTGGLEIIRTTQLRLSTINNPGRTSGAGTQPGGKDQFTNPIFINGHLLDMDQKVELQHLDVLSFGSSSTTLTVVLPETPEGASLVRFADTHVRNSKGDSKFKGKHRGTTFGGHRGTTFGGHRGTTFGGHRGTTFGGPRGTTFQHRGTTILGHRASQFVHDPPVDEEAPMTSIEEQPSRKSVAVAPVRKSVAPGAPRSMVKQMSRGNSGLAARTTQFQPSSVPRSTQFNFASHRMTVRNNNQMTMVEEDDEGAEESMSMGKQTSELWMGKQTSEEPMRMVKQTSELWESSDDQTGSRDSGFGRFKSKISPKANPMKTRMTTMGRATIKSGTPMVSPGRLGPGSEQNGEVIWGRNPIVATHEEWGFLASLFDSVWKEAVKGQPELKLSELCLSACVFRRYIFDICHYIGPVLAEKILRVVEEIQELLKEANGIIYILKPRVKSDFKSSEDDGSKVLNLEVRFLTGMYDPTAYASQLKTEDDVVAWMEKGIGIVLSSEPDLILAVWTLEEFKSRLQWMREVQSEFEVNQTPDPGGVLVRRPAENPFQPMTRKIMQEVMNSRRKQESAGDPPVNTGVDHALYHAAQNQLARLEKEMARLRKELASTKKELFFEIEGHDRTKKALDEAPMSIALSLLEQLNLVPSQTEKFEASCRMLRNDPEFADADLEEGPEVAALVDVLHDYHDDLRRRQQELEHVVNCQKAEMTQVIAKNYASKEGVQKTDAGAMAKLIEDHKADRAALMQRIKELQAAKADAEAKFAEEDIIIQRGQKKAMNYDEKSAMGLFSGGDAWSPKHVAAAIGVWRSQVERPLRNELVVLQGGSLRAGKISAIEDRKVDYDSSSYWKACEIAENKIPEKVQDGEKTQ